MKRLTFEIDDDAFDKLQDLLPWGMRAAALRCMVELMIAGLEKGGPHFVGALITGEITLTPTHQGEE